jgi:hypothetical protein
MSDVIGQCDKCENDYELSDRTNRCGDCGYCNKCCFHTVEGVTNGKL